MQVEDIVDSYTLRLKFEICLFHNMSINSDYHDRLLSRYCSVM